MPPTHPSQADVAAAYRTLIAHETEPKEQDFYRTRLQRLEQATESVCEFDCRSRVAAAGVGDYCPQCSAKSADTDLATQLAKAMLEDFYGPDTWDEDDHSSFKEHARAALEFLAGRLIPAGGTALTAEQVEDVRTVVSADAAAWNRLSPALFAAYRLRRALFPATEPAVEVTQAEGFCSFCGWSRDACARGEGECAPAEPAESATQSAGGDCFDVCEGHPVETPDAAGTPIRLTLGTDEITEPWSQTQYAVMSEVGDRVFEIDWDRGGTEEALDCIVGGRLVTRDVHYGAWKLVDAPTPAPAEPAEEETKAEACAGIFQGDRVYRCALADGHYGDHTTAKGEHWQKRPASSPVVEEETKADPFKALHDVISFSSMDFGSVSDVAWMYGIVVGWDNDDPDEGEHPHAAMRELAQRFNWPYRKVQLLRNLHTEWIRRTSSPVVPAPTETGPWPTWDVVPDGVKYSPKARPPAGSPLRLLAQPLWVNRGGTRYQARSGSVSKIGDVEMFHYAPFVAAEEGRA